MPTPRAGIDYLPDNFDEPPPEPWPLWAQVVLFASVYVCLQWLWSLARQTIIERIAIADITVRPAVWAIHQLTPSVDAVASRFNIDAPGGGINILNGCEGFEVLFLLVAALGVAPISWSRRALGWVGGTLLVWLLNQLRILVLFYTYRADKNLFVLLHGSIAPLVLIVCVTIAFTLFVGLGSPASAEHTA